MDKIPFLKRRIFVFVGVLWTCASFLLFGRNYDDSYGDYASAAQCYIQSDQLGIEQSASYAFQGDYAKSDSLWQEADRYVVDWVFGGLVYKDKQVRF